MQHTTATQVLRRDAAAVRELRSWLVAELGARTPLDAERIDDTALMVSELATNVLVHTASDGAVTITTADDSVRVEVADQGAGLPVLRDVDPTRVGGNGLRIVDSWSTEWGVDRHADGGKVVWLCVRY
ncbi:MAG TPA: ATP-binding protein [Aquihabitans sp.]|jgi:anti-sigma regulatory factor (Ser/Thr protein kinase)|nr:ATP-binding protein [Aquihabitans sp.]